MSHAANLRAHQQASSSAKRRKLSGGNTHTRPGLNGINGLFSSNGSKSLTAKQPRNAKASSLHTQEDTHPRIGHAAEDEDVTEPANGFHSGNDNDAIEVSDVESGDGDGEDDEQEDGDNENDALSQANGVPVQTLSQKAQSTTHGDDDDDDGDDEAGSGEPTFGDMLRAHDTDQIDVGAEDAPSSRLQSARSAGALAPPPAASLGTVLTQALRSNDTPLLESCLQISNLQDIRATVERIPSSQAASLLQKLAERMHRRPGRAGSLMVWVQWTVVAHGGYLASQPATMKEVRELYRVVKLRATGLQPLLALKGKLDMLEAQVALRRRRTATAPGNREEDVIYVEDDESSDDEEEAMDAAIEAGEDSGDDADMPLTNGASVPASDDEDAEGGLDEELESDEDDDENLIDDEAVSTDDEDDEGGLDEEIVFDEDEQSEDEAQARPSKRTKSK